jgi:hypothetical protein
MNFRTAWGIALLVGGSFAVLVGCGASGTASAGSGGVSGGSAGSGSDSDASAGRGGGEGPDGGEPSDSVVGDAFGCSDADAPPEAIDAGDSDGHADARGDATDAAVDRGGVTDAPPWLGKSCVERCNADRDCVPSLPVADFECDLGTRRCVQCRNDLACVATASGWVLACASAGDCMLAGDVCIEVNGLGRCAFTSATCGGIFPDDIAVREFGTATMVTVCGVGSSACRDGRCVDRCGPIHTCTPEQGGRTCNEITGQCECTDDNDCAGGVGVSKCNETTRRCECARNADCEGTDDVDICVDGRCGCSSVSVCTPDFKGTTLSCE